MRKNAWQACGVNGCIRSTFPEITDFQLISGQRGPHDDDLVGLRKVERPARVLVEHVLLQRAVMQQLDADETGETRKRWLNFEKFLKEERMRSKYNTLIKKGMYTPSWLAKESHASSGTSVDFEYVYLPYSSVPDSEVSVEESEVKQYLKKIRAQRLGV